MSILSKRTDDRAGQTAPDARGTRPARHFSGGGGRASGFTLIELLAVIAIIGVTAAIVAPNIGKFRTSATVAAERQLLGELANARQLAIAQRTTVYMVFVPTNFFASNTAVNPNMSAFQYLVANQPAEWNKTKRLLDKQAIGYAFVALRTLGDQPGQHSPRYLSTWRTLPDGAYIPLEKFGPSNLVNLVINIPSGYASPPFNTNVFGLNTYSVPFPSENSLSNFSLPGVGFNYAGQLISGVDEVIPLALGSVNFSRDAYRNALPMTPSFTETPPGNGTNSYDLVKVEWLTGRARAERLEVR